MYKLVLIDDDDIFVTGIQKHVDFSVLGITVAGTANNGDMGLKLIEEFNPHIVITDIDMPGIDGIELLKNAKAMPTPPLVILITGLDGLKYAKEAVYYNAFAYLTKPVFPPEISDTLKHAVSTLSIDSLYDKAAANYACSHNNKHDFMKCIDLFIENLKGLDIFEISMLQNTIYRLMKMYIDTFHFDKIFDKIAFKENLNAITSKEGFIAFINSTISEFEIYLPSHRITTADKTVENVKKCIDENFTDTKLSVSYLSDIFDISPNYLRSKFKSKYNISFKDYLTKTRMTAARSLLKTGNYKIYEVASMVGYNDVTLFRKTYKAYFNTTPSSVI